MTEPTTTEPTRIRATAIKAGRLSMAHMRQAMQGEREDTAAMRWGRLIHMAILEPLKLAEMPQWGGARRAGKEWEAFVAAVGAGDYLMPGELPELAAITTSTRFALATMPAMVETERRVDWTGDRYGAATARIDGLLKGGGFIEVKSCRNIEKRAFLSQCYSLGYHLQLGWYNHGLAAIGLGGQVRVLAVESAAPYTCACYTVPPAILAQGYEEAAEIAAQYRACEAFGTFAGPYDDVTLQYEFPAWAGGKAEEVEIGTGEEGKASEL